MAVRPLPAREKGAAKPKWLVDAVHAAQAALTAAPASSPSSPQPSPPSPLPLSPLPPAPLPFRRRTTSSSGGSPGGGTPSPAVVEWSRKTSLQGLADRLLCFKPEAAGTLLRAAAGGGAPALAAARAVITAEAALALPALGRHLLVLDAGYTAACKANSFNSAYDSLCFAGQVLYSQGDAGGGAGDASSEPPSLYLLSRVAFRTLAWLAADPCNCVLLLPASAGHAPLLAAACLLLSHTVSPARWDVLSADAIAGVSGASREVCIVRLLDSLFALMAPPAVAKAVAAATATAASGTASSATSSTGLASALAVPGFAPLHPLPPRLDEDDLEPGRIYVDAGGGTFTSTAVWTARPSRNVVPPPAHPTTPAAMAANTAAMLEAEAEKERRKRQRRAAKGTGRSSSSGGSGGGGSGSNGGEGEGEGVKILSYGSGLDSYAAGSGGSIAGGDGGWGCWTGRAWPVWLTVPALAQLLAFASLTRLHLRQEDALTLTNSAGTDSSGGDDSGVSGAMRCLLIEMLCEIGERRRRLLKRAHDADAGLLTPNSAAAAASAKKPGFVAALLQRASSGGSATAGKVSATGAGVMGRSGSALGLRPADFEGDSVEPPPLTALPQRAPLKLPNSFLDTATSADGNSSSSSSTDVVSARLQWCPQSIQSLLLTRALLSTMAPHQHVLRQPAPIVLRYLSLSCAPMAQQGEVNHAESGACPMVMVLCADPRSGAQRMVYSSMISGRKRYRHSYGPVLIPLNVAVCGEMVIKVFDSSAHSAGQRLLTVRSHTLLLTPAHAFRAAAAAAESWISVTHVGRDALGVAPHDPRFPTDFHISLCCASVPSLHAARAAATAASGATSAVLPAHVPASGGGDAERVYALCHMPGCYASTRVPPAALQRAAEVARLKHGRLTARRNAQLAHCAAAGLPASLAAYDYDDLSEGDAELQLLTDRAAASGTAATTAIATAIATDGSDDVATAAEAMDGEEDGAAAAATIPVLVAPSSTSASAAAARLLLTDGGDRRPPASAPWTEASPREQLLRAEAEAVTAAAEAARAVAAAAPVLAAAAAAAAAAAEAEARSRRTLGQHSKSARSLDATDDVNPLVLARSSSDGSTASAASSKGSSRKLKTAPPPPPSPPPAAVVAAAVAEEEEQAIIPGKDERGGEPAVTLVASARCVCCIACEALLYVPAAAAVLAGLLPEAEACAPHIPPLDARVKNSAAAAATARVSATAHPFDVPAAQDASKGVVYQALLSARSRRLAWEAQQVSEVAAMFPSLDHDLIEEEVLAALRSRYSDELEEVVQSLSMLVLRQEKGDKGVAARVEAARAAAAARRRQEAANRVESPEDEALDVPAAIAAAATPLPSAEASAAAAAASTAAPTAAAAAAAAAAASEAVTAYITDASCFLPSSHLQPGSSTVQTPYGRGTVLGVRLHNGGAAGGGASGASGVIAPVWPSGAATRVGTGPLLPWEVAAAITTVAVQLPWGVAWCVPATVTVVTESLLGWEAEEAAAAAAKAARRAEREAKRAASAAKSKAIREAKAASNATTSPRRKGAAAEEAVEEHEEEEAGSGSGSSGSDSEGEGGRAGRSNRATSKRSGAGGAGLSRGRSSGRSGRVGLINDTSHDADAELARALQMQMLAEALEDGAADDADGVMGGGLGAGGGANSTLLALTLNAAHTADKGAQEAMLAMALSAAVPSLAPTGPPTASSGAGAGGAGGAASGSVVRRKYPQKPGIVHFPTLAAVDFTLLRSFIPHQYAYTPAEAAALLPPPTGVTCVYAPADARPRLPGCPEALPSSSPQLRPVREALLAARVDGTAFDTSGHQAADPTVIAHLPLVIYQPTSSGGAAATAAAAAADSGSSCAICMDDYVPGDRLRRLGCGHELHARCADPWLLMDARCPMCLQPVRPPKQ